MISLPNKGRQLNYVSGIQGVSPGGVATFNLPANLRLHDITLQLTAVNYTGGTALATKHLTGSGNDALTVTPTIVNGAVTAVAVVAAGSGYAQGDTFTITDATGTGCVCTVATVSGSTVATVTVTNGGTASPISPSQALTGIRTKVNGVLMRDTTPALELMVQQANGYNSQLGELLIPFTEPWRNFVRNNDANSWDLVGQNTFSVDLLLGPNLSPGVSGLYEFDFARNTITDAQGNVGPNLEPISHHTFSYTLGGGMNAITTIPFSYPIARLWLLGSSPGNLTQIEILQDNNKILEGTTAQIKEMYQRYGFRFGQPDYLNQTQTAQKPLAYNPVNYFDLAAIFDLDGRYQKALQGKTLELRVWSNTNQQLSVVVEALPGAYR